MARVVSNSSLHMLRRVIEEQRVRELPDADLLARFTAERDEQAFQALVRRHGTMVLDVCRGVLGNEADAEDSFQATFLILACKAGTIQKRESVASWLHGVAYRTALKARGRRAVRKRHEARVLVPQAGDADALSWREVQQVLHEELGRLAERYRAPLVLCYLEGARQDQAAAELGVAKSTLKERLERGRALLRARLQARGLGPAAILSVAAWPGARAAAAVSAELISSTTQAATLCVAGRAAVTTLAPAVAALTQGALTPMFATNLKTAAAVLLILGMALGTVTWISHSPAMQPAQPQEQAKREKLHDRILDLKQQLQRMQDKIASLEQETQPLLVEHEQGEPFPANRLKHRIPFEIGWSEVAEGGRIDIKEVWGTRPRIEVGGQYLVRGSYVLPPNQRGTLYFYETADGTWGTGPTANMDLQYSAVDKQKGEFTLMHGMAGPGYFHLVLADPERYSRQFANVYFGTGANVWRKNPR